MVQVLNAQREEAARSQATLRELAAALVHYGQGVLPVVDARDRVAQALAVDRSELVVERVERRTESLGRRVDGLHALGDRLLVVEAELAALRAALSAPAGAASPSAPAPAPAMDSTAVGRLRDDALYVAFENRFRGPREEIRARLASYVEAFTGLSPVADLGCGRGEFLELLREAGTLGVGAEQNARAVQECHERGLAVEATDLLTFLRGRADGSLGGVFAAQVAEHLPPQVLVDVMRESARALRRGGLLVFETPNPRSVTGFLEVWTRDLTHERALHPDTLRFLAAAAGFGEARVEYRSPVPEAAQLQPIPTDGLPQPAAAALGEAIERLNGLLYGPQEYALFARR
ncbi:MAG: class I SAM-dependent methyltransferase [Vicinamibacteria bacterium]|nr:class I SAM-dependent methyltransferase [Vicinamibacteria bacterium]